MTIEEFQGDESGDQGGDAPAPKAGKAGAKKKPAPGPGHNSEMTKKRAGEFRRRFKEIQDAEADAKRAGDAVKELYRAAKESGFNIAAMRHVAKWRKKDDQARLDFESEVEAYRRALPAVEREEGAEADG